MGLWITIVEFYSFGPAEFRNFINLLCSLHVKYVIYYLESNMWPSILYVALHPDTKSKSTLPRSTWLIPQIDSFKNMNPRRTTQNAEYVTHLNHNPNPISWASEVPTNPNIANLAQIFTSTCNSAYVGLCWLTFVCCVSIFDFRLLWSTLVYFGLLWSPVISFCFVSKSLIPVCFGIIYLLFCVVHWCSVLSLCWYSWRNKL